MTPKKHDAVSLVVTLPAAPDHVWNAWTQARLMGWYGSDPQGTVVEAKADVRKGGRYRVTFENSDGSRYTCLGTYLTVERPRLLEFTWTWEGRDDRTERVRAAFAETGGGTTMLFEHLDIDPATSHDYAAGWRTCFGKLERQLRG